MPHAVLHHWSLRASLALTVVSGASLAAQRDAEPAALRGSKPSVERMYAFATSHGLPFYATPDAVTAAVATGRLVPLPLDSTFDVWGGMANPVVTRATRSFVLAFAPQYAAACGTRLTVTSGTRSIQEQPRNAVPHSVHPTGIAVDFRRPEPGPCLAWVRSALASLEARGLIEATEEHHPVHLHVAVLTPVTQRVVLPTLVTGPPVPRVPMDTSTAGVVFPRATVPGRPGVIRWGDVRVRPGDTMLAIATRVGVPPAALAGANSLHLMSPLRPGTTLRVPDTAASTGMAPTAGRSKGHPDR
jgi:hypothetical protein